MKLEVLQELYRRCHDEPLDPDDDRFADFDRANARGVSWVRRLGNRLIKAADRPTWSLVSGLPGSGKSTELRRLKEHLQKSGFLVALVDAEEIFDLTQEIDLTDILLVLVDAAEREVVRLEGSARGQEKEPGYLRRLWSWLSSVEVDLKDLSVSGGPLELAFEMKTNPSLRQRIRAGLSRHFNRFVAEAQKELGNLDRRAKARKSGGLCLILDSLEKLRGLSSNWREVLESAERVFRSGAPHLRLPVHSIFTVPPALVFRLNVDVEFMPAIKLKDRKGHRFEPGFAALREVVTRRLATAEQGEALAVRRLEELLGPHFEARLDSLIETSGGYTRQVVKALTWLLELDEQPATELDLARLDNEVNERFRAVVTGEMVPLRSLGPTSRRRSVPHLPLDA